MKDKIDFYISIIERLMKSPDVLISSKPKLFSNYKAYIEGMFLFQKRFFGVNMERIISEWYQSKAEIKAPNMYWFAQFSLTYKDKSEEDEILIFLKTLHDFLTSKYLSNLLVTPQENWNEHFLG